MAVSAALVVALSPASRSVVGGLPLAIRAARVLKAAGFTDVRVLDQRARDVEPGSPAAGAPVLVIAGDILFESDVLAPLLAAAACGQLRVGQHPAMAAGEVPAAICPRPDLPRLVAGLRDESGTLGRALDRLGGAGAPPVALGQGLFLAPGPGVVPAALTTALLDHLGRRTAGTDGYLTTLLDRRLSRAITRRLLAWPVTPNQITVVSILLGLGGAVGLATVSYAGRLAGVLGLLASSVLDGVDGELARARLEQSRFGARLDVAGDYVVHLGTFLALGIGLARQGLPRAGLWAAAALVGGVGAAMAAVHALVIRPALTADGAVPAAGGSPGLRKMPVVEVVEKIASRDYAYLLLVAALVGHLEWFVYAAAAGAWGFVAGLLAYWTYERRKGAPTPAVVAGQRSD